jgi:prephenate dehydrogenase
MNKDKLIVDTKIHEELGMKILTKEDVERIDGTAQLKKPLVVGYKGEIGSFILNGLLRVMPKALDIWCVDVNETGEEIGERIEKSDMIFLCIPMGITVDWLLEHKEELRGKVIVEQCSLKENICNDERLKGLDVRSMHILFRPSQTPDKADRRLALVEHQFSREMEKKLLEITDSHLVVYESIEEHDKEMAIQQALVHRGLLLMGEALRGCKGSTFVSKRVIELSDRIAQGDVELYKQIQDNRHLPEHLEKLEKGLRNFEIEKFMK